KRVTPIFFSIFLIWLLKGGCEIFNLFAALLKCSSSANTIKYFICLILIIILLSHHYFKILLVVFILEISICLHFLYIFSNLLLYFLYFYYLFYLYTLFIILYFILI